MRHLFNGYVLPIDMATAPIKLAVSAQKTAVYVMNINNLYSEI